MTTTDIYRKYAADCIRMSQEREYVGEKLLLIQMATMWLELAKIAERAAELVEKNGGGDESSSDL